MIVKKRAPKRFNVNALKERVKVRSVKDGYKGVAFKNIIWDTLRYDISQKKQIIDIKTVDANGKLDGNIRTIATSDLHLVKHVASVSKILQRERSNARRRKNTK